MSKGKKQSELRETFKSNEEILMGLLKSDLAGVASASIQVVKELVRSLLCSLPLPR